MLTELHIRNIAVIQQATIAFGAALNVFTGETGAGKTILLSAIDAVLGERASRDIIRTGEASAFVSALFEDISPRARGVLEACGYSDENGSVLISREMTESGKNTCKINGMPATTAILREIAAPLIHVHGQRDSLQLLEPERHRELVDAFGGYGEQFAAYEAAYTALRATESELAALQMDDRQKEQRLDMLRFQVREIEAAGLGNENEEEELLARRAIIRNSEKIQEALSLAYNALHGDERSGGVAEGFGDLCAGVRAAARFMDELSPMSQRLEEIHYELREYAQELRDSLESLEFDPRELDDIENRLALLHNLQKKYGRSTAEILAHCEGARREIEAITTSGQRRRELGELRDTQEAQTRRLGAALTQLRMEAARRFTELIERELAFLDMPMTSLLVQREEKPPAEDGMDDMAFFITTNVGEAPKPLSKIASGGELSRVMLAVKNVLAHRDDVGTLIFDEVDTGVSGRAAGKIGQKLREAAKSRQVICVTHLAQVAAFADTHMQIYKEVEQGRTFTRIAQLDEEARVRELARLTSGDAVTGAALDNAREMLARRK